MGSLMPAKRLNDSPKICIHDVNAEPNGEQGFVMSSYDWGKYIRILTRAHEVKTIKIVYWRGLKTVIEALNMLRTLQRLARNRSLPIILTA